MRSIISKNINVNGLDCHYYSGGQGEPLIIIHGGGDGASAWMNNMAILANKYTIYVPDLPGFGDSQPIPGGFHMQEMAEFVNHFAASIGLKRFYIMGHSLGGGIALHYALKYPQNISKLVLVSSLCLGKDIAWWIRLFSSPVFIHSLGKMAMSFYKGVIRVARYFGPWEIVNPVTSTSLQIGIHITSLTQQTRVLLSQLPQIMAPTLVMWGAKDPVVPFAQAYAAAELIPDCQVKVFEDCGHSVYRDRLPEFSNTLARFLG